jgi:hypothetical protein
MKYIAVVRTRRLRMLISVARIPRAVAPFLRFALMCEGRTNIRLSTNHRARTIQFEFPQLNGVMVVGMCKLLSVDDLE